MKSRNLGQIRPPISQKGVTKAGHRSFMPGTTQTFLFFPPVFSIRTKASKEVILCSVLCSGM